MARKQQGTIPAAQPTVPQQSPRVWPARRHPTPRELDLVAETAAKTAAALAQTQRASEQRPTSPPAAPASSGGSTWFRTRRLRRPFYVAAGLAGAAETAHLLSRFTGDSWTRDPRFYVVDALVGLAAVVAARRLAPARWRLRAQLATFAAAAWLTWSISRGPVDWTSAFILASGTVAMSARYWQTTRLGYPTSPPTKPKRLPPQAVMRPSLPDRDDTAGNFMAHVARKGGALEGACLHSPEITDEYEKWIIAGVPGVHSVAIANANFERIVSGLRRRKIEVLIEESPSGDASEMLLTIVKRSPIQEAVPFDGPKWFTDETGKNGWVEPGWYADGRDRVKVPFRGPNSAYHCCIIGGQGSGKTELLNVLAISLLSSGQVMLWYLDGQHGTSSPQLRRHADWAPMGEDAAHVMLRALEKEVRRRERYMRRCNLHGIYPAPEYPHLVLIVDECHAVWDVAKYGALYIKRWENIARISRKLCISIIAATQHPSLDSFGGSDTLRSMLMQYSTLVLRTQSSVAKNILRISMDPSTLPILPGYGFIESNYPGVRSAPWRSDHVVGDPPEDGGESDADLWFLQYPSLALPESAAKKLSEEYEKRREIAAKEFERLVADEDDDEEYDDEDEPRYDSGGVSTGSGVVNPPAIPDSLVMGVVQVPAGVTGKAVDVYRAVAAGKSRAADIVAALEGKAVRSTVYRVLGELVEAGHLVKDEAGNYSTHSSREE